MNYYNEIDPYAAQWLRNLIDAGHIARGDVDERSIVDVRADELAGYTQCHFFAGIGGWSVALRLAGWPDDRPVWTGSCPCQPFSAAGKREAADDERHLWPAWFPLIAQRRPPVVFGEQVEAAIGWGWLDAVFADLEAEGYACGAAVLPACGVGAPHIRQRTWFVANMQIERWDAGRPGEAGGRPPVESAGYGYDRELADAYGRDAGAARLQRGWEHGQQPEDGRTVSLADSEYRPCRDARKLAKAEGDGIREVSRQRAGVGLARISSPVCELGDADASRLSPCKFPQLPGAQQLDEGRAAQQPGRSSWADLDWLPCTDGKARPVESGTFPLAHGIPGRVGRLRAYGNAIVPQVAAEFIKAASD